MFKSTFFIDITTLLNIGFPKSCYFCLTSAKEHKFTDTYHTLIYYFVFVIAKNTSLFLELML